MEVGIPKTVIELNQEEAEWLGKLACLSCEILNSSIRDQLTIPELARAGIDNYDFSKIRDFAEKLHETVGRS